MWSLYIQVIMHVQELRNQCYMLTFLNDYKHKRTIALNPIHGRRLAVNANLISKYLIRQTFWPLTVITILLFVGATLVAYLDPDSGFNIISVVTWSILLSLFMVNCFGLVCVGFLIWVICCLYLIYKFKELSEKVKHSIQVRNVSLLMSAITEHNSVSKLTKQLNDFFSLMIFIIYYMASPTIMLLVYLSHAAETILIARLVAVFVVTIVISVVASLTLFSSLISQSAEKPRKYLYKCFAQRILKKSLTLEKRLKVMAFVEKMSGPDIGFYCWDLFAMNNNQFYFYVANCAKSYFLILDIINIT